jgi:hypothetical protein
LKALRNQAVVVKQELAKLEAAKRDFEKALRASVEIQGCALVYKDSAHQIIHAFYDEFRLQNWGSAQFVSLCQSLLEPFSTRFSSDSVASAVVGARRLMRQIRLTKPTIQASSLTAIDRILTKTEASLRDSFDRSYVARVTLIEKQRSIVQSFIDLFEKLPGTNINGFVVRLMHNLSLDLATMDTFDAGGIARDISILYSNMSCSNDKMVQIQSLVGWLGAITPGVFPVDYDHLLEILKGILTAMEEPDEGTFVSNQDAIVDLAAQLSDGLAALSSLRLALSQVKDVHRLFPIRPGLFTFAQSVIRLLEAYAEEIHTFPLQSHPIVPIVKSLMVMCANLEHMIDASFADGMKKRHTEEAVQGIRAFLASCPPHVAETVSKYIDEPIRLIEGFDIK